MQTFPSSAIVSVPSTLAVDLLQAAEALPIRQNQDYYSFKLQQEVHDHVRTLCQEGLEWLVAEVKTRLKQPPFTVLIKGLQFDDHYRVFVALSHAFGYLTGPAYNPETPQNQVIQHTRPVTDIAVSATQKGAERLHTDCAEWLEPSDYIAMQCVRPDHLGGGRSRLIDRETLGLALQELADPEIVDLLHKEAVPWQLSAYLGGGAVWRPILTPETLCWRRYTVEFALADLGIELSAAMLTAFDQFESVLNHTDRIMDYILEAGDLQIMDNRRCLHARTPIENPETPRFMLRTWLFETPPAHAEASRFMLINH